LLVPLCFRSSCQSVPQCSTNFGSGALARSIEFYERLGFVRKARGSEGVAFFDAGGIVLALWSWVLLAEDANLACRPRPEAFRGSALAWNCSSPSAVDATLAAAAQAGGRLLKVADKVFWGGYSGYFADPEGHVWEVAHNPGFPLSEDGRLTLPD
jgi:uncharacterized protein